MFCKKCREDNLNYNNYCLNDGENLDTIPIKLTLQTNLNKYCSKCGENIEDNENYCSSCGEMIEILGQKNKSFVNDKIGDLGNILESPKNLKSKLTNISLENFKNIDKKGIVLSVGLTLILCSILIAAYNSLLYSNPDLINEIEYYYGYSMPSEFKSFMFALASMNLPNMDLALKVSLVNIFNLSFVGRCIVYPLIIGLFMFISVRLGLRNDSSENRVLENSLSCAALYSIIMVIIGFMGSYNLSLEEGTSLTVSISTLNLFINSFIISFVGAYMGMSKSENNMISGFMKKSLISILAGIGIIGVIITFFTLEQMNENLYLDEFLSYYSFNQKAFLIIIGILAVIILASWLFTLSHFVALSAFEFTSFNMISLTKNLDAPIILLSIIPIVLLFLTGRKIKSTHGENQIKTIGIYSSIYALAMVALSYFSRVALSLNYGDIGEYLYEFIYSLVSEFNYYYASTIADYFAQISGNLNSGVYLGSNLFLTIIITFIFSFVFVFLGYKSKK